MKLMTKMLCLAFCATCLPAIAATWYVSASGGSDANSGTDWATAKQSIQSAIDAAGSGDTIIVTNGVYGPIITANKAITVTSISGAAFTAIDGGGSQRCAYLGEDTNQCQTVLSGFTLQNGNVYVSWGGMGGAGVKGGTLYDCVITNCLVSGSWSGYGGEGGGAGGTKLHRCEIVDCKALAGGGANSSELHRCVIRNCYAYDDGGGLHCCYAVNCLVVRNYGNDVGGYGCGYGLAGCTAENCTVAYNTGRSGGGIASSILYNCIAYANLPDNIHQVDSRSTATVLDHCMTDDPLFVDAANGDYRISAESPCVDAGDNGFVLEETDFAGRNRISGTFVDIGAYEYQQDGSDAISWLYVSFDSNWDDGMVVSNRYVANSVVRYFPPVTRAGYYLDGWYTDRNGGSKVDLGTEVLSCPSILYAHWTDYSSAQRAALDMKTSSTLGDNGSSVWVVDASTYHTGNSSLKSAAIGDSQSTYQTLTVHGTGSVSFWWKVSSESNYDHLRYYVDGVEQAAISGEVDWQQKTVTFSTEGEHVIKWQYSKDGSVSRGSDCGWIDGVEINMTGEHLPVSGRDIVLDLNGSAETNWVCRVEDGQPFGALPTPEWIGHRFIGWFTQADGGDAVSEETVVDSSCLKLYARWTSVCTIAFDVGGVATGSVECIFREIGNAIGELPKSTMTQDTGFILLGWFTLPEGGKMVTEKTVVLSDMTLYAHWAMAGEVSIVSCGVRETDATILDVIYRVNSTNATANVRALAFENGEESFAKVVRPETFVDNTGRNLGYMVPANTNLTLSWKVTDDWDVKLARVKFMILVEENFYPLPLDLVTIPANGSHRAVTFSANEISSDVFRDALFWLYADHDEGLTLENGVLSAGGVILANGAELVPAAAARYVFKTMGYSLLDGAELEYVNETARLNLKSEGTEQHAFKQD